MIKLLQGDCLDKMKEIKLKESIRAEVKNIIKEIFKTK